MRAHKAYEQLKLFCDNLHIDCDLFQKDILELQPIFLLFYDPELDRIIVETKNGKKYRFNRRDYEA